MEKPIHKAIKILGLTGLARAVGVKPPTVSQWADGRRPIPICRCVSIEQVTKGVVTRQELRPDDWQLIWPDLVKKSKRAGRG